MGRNLEAGIRGNGGKGATWKVVSNLLGGSDPGQSQIVDR